MNYPEDFEKAFTFVMKWEGGYVCDKDDPGGETKFGISKRAHPDLDVKNLTEEEAKKIYFNEYWKPMIQIAKKELPNMPFPSMLMTFDAAVNQGVEFASRLPTLLFSKGMAWFRIQRYFAITKQNPKLKKYFYGWVSRVFDCLAAGEK